jgi:hypothetical protein
MFDSPDVSKKKRLLDSAFDKPTQQRLTGLAYTPYRSLGGNIVKKTDRVGTVAHIAQKGSWSGRVPAGRMASAMYDAAQTPPYFRHIVNNRRMDDPKKRRVARKVAPPFFLTSMESGCNYTK